MRILFFDNNPVLRNLLPTGFVNLGHDVKLSGPFSHEEIPEIVNTFNPQLIVVQGWHNELTWVKLEEISNEAKTKGIPIVYWSVEDPNFTKEFILPIVQTLKPTIIFTISREVIELYNNYGFVASYLDFATNPVAYSPIKRSSPSYDYNITVISNSYAHAPEWYSYRFEMMRTLITPLIQANIKVDLWGENWHKMRNFLGVEIPSSWIHKEILSYERALEIYKNSKINIGLQNSPEQVTLRTYDILGANGFLLTANTPGVAERFVPESELVTSSSPEETVMKAMYYLENDEQREMIKQRGLKRVQNYTYTNRAAEVLETLQLYGILY